VTGAPTQPLNLPPTYTPAPAGTPVALATSAPQATPVNLATAVPAATPAPSNNFCSGAFLAPLVLLVPFIFRSRKKS